ncbi:substrate-binding periplasmic protein [Litoribrevibacter albus]|nr:transporter substrate-binding domain-containing protein [Litoribrevibacter albus]
MKLVRNLIIVLFCWWCSSVLADAHGLVNAMEKRVTVATSTHNPPFNFDKPNAKLLLQEILPPGQDSERLQGYSLDILRESFHEMGYTIELHVYPWPRAFDEVKKGNLDILFPTGFNEERTQFFQYSHEPINHVEFLIYVKPSSTLVWNGLDSLDGLLIGVLRGWNYGPKWQTRDRIVKYEINEILQGFYMLDHGHVDGLAGYKLNFDYALKQANKKQRFKQLPVFDSTDEYAVTAKNHPHGKQLLTDFDEGKRRIIENGTFLRITNKWQGTEEAHIRK